MDIDEFLEKEIQAKKKEGTGKKEDSAKLTILK